MVSPRRTFIRMIRGPGMFFASFFDVFGVLHSDD